MDSRKYLNDADPNYSMDSWRLTNYAHPNYRRNNSRLSVVKKTTEGFSNVGKTVGGNLLVRNPTRGLFLSKNKFLNSETSIAFMMERLCTMVEESFK